MSMSSNKEIIDRYFTALQRKDFATIRTLVHDDVTFKGALGTTNTAEDYINGLRQITANTTLERRALFAEGENVCQIYEMILPTATIPIAQWFTLREGRIATLQVFFDPRPMLPPSRS